MVFENCLRILSGDNFVNNRRCTKMILTKIVLEIECSNVVLLKLSLKLTRWQFCKLRECNEDIFLKNVLVSIHSIYNIVITSPFHPACRALGQKFLHGSLTSCASSSVMPIVLSLTLVNHSHTDFTLSTACCVTVVIQVHLFIFSFNRPLCPWLITTLVQFCCVFV